MARFSVHNHTEYSNVRLLDCVIKLESLIERGKEAGLAGLAVTDHEILAQNIAVNKLQKKNKDFKIAMGNEIYLTDTRDMGQKYFHFILIAKDAKGNKQLRQLSSRAWMSSFWDRGMERVPTLKSELEEIVLEDPGHLIATSACLGGELSSCVLEMENARQIGDKRTETIRYNQVVSFMEYADRLFGDDFYIEVAPSASPDQIIVNIKLAEIAKVFNKKLVIGDDSHFLKQEDRHVHKAYLNSKGGERETDAFYQYSFLHDEEECRRDLEPSIGHLYEEMCDNSMEIFDKIQDYDLEHSPAIPKVPVKEYKRAAAGKWGNRDTLNSLSNSESLYDRYWVNECANKLEELDLLNDEYLDRLEEEARVKDLIGKKLHTNMFKYPITLQYYIDMIWETGSLVAPGRGSACAALNHYLLDITQLDPVEWNLPFFRYLNDARVELGDIDIDICPSKKDLVVSKIKEERGQRFKEGIDSLSKENLGCTLIATYGTEGTKSTVLTACRGYRSEEFPNGIDNDEAQYIASLVPSERGFLWTLKDVYQGNPDKGRKPVAAFKQAVDAYEGLLEIMMGIEGLVNKRSSHASGVILFDEDPYEAGVFMKTPKGEIITQYNLKDCESAGMTKYDFLVTDVQDKLAQTLRLLQEDGVIEDEGVSLRGVYNKYLHPNIIPIDDKDTWKAIQNNSVINVFQFDSEVGAQAAKKIKPKTILELADANGLMRLMSGGEGQEQPMEKYIRYKNDLSLWYDEMDKAGLTKEEQKVLEPHFKKSYGVPPSQEQLMTMLMDEKICSFTLGEANTARKIVGKKQMDKIPDLRKKIYEQATSPALGRYVWRYGIGPQMGYSFSVIHALAYSFVGFQTAYVATKWNPIYWDTACLVVNSGSLEPDLGEKDDLSKKKTSTPDYGKMAKAIGEIRETGIKVSLVDINKSDYSFKPDVENNQILFGMKALSGVNEEMIGQIKEGREYRSIKEFLAKVKINKTATISLIKAGAFDRIVEPIEGFNSREVAMAYYLSLTSNPKKKLTLSNFNGLLSEGIVPDTLQEQKKIFLFNKHLRGNKYKDYFFFKDPTLVEWFSSRYGMDTIDRFEKGFYFLEQKKWVSKYNEEMDMVRDWLKSHEKAILKVYNTKLFLKEWEKYATGNIPSWEMDSLCFYYSGHELNGVDNRKYGISDFEKLPADPEVETTFRRNGKEIPIFKLTKIAGTAIAKNDTRRTVTLLTTSGVVNVKFTRDYYAMYNRQLSAVKSDGTKTVVEKGWFSRGTKLVVTGFRRDDTFVAKRYARTPGHTLYKITSVDGDEIGLTSLRYGQEEQ